MSTPRSDFRTAIVLLVVLLALVLWATWTEARTRYVAADQTTWRVGDMVPSRLSSLVCLDEDMAESFATLPPGPGIVQAAQMAIASQLCFPLRPGLAVELAEWRSGPHDDGTPITYSVWRVKSKRPETPGFVVLADASGRHQRAVAN